MKCMCKANHPDPDIREEYCDGVPMTLFDLNYTPPYYYCCECGKTVLKEVTA